MKIVSGVVAAALIVGLVLFAVDYVNTRNQVIAPAPAAQVSTAAVTENATTTNVSDDEYIVVRRGATDQETINIDNSWPTYDPDETDTIDWSNNSFHMGGGTWTIKEDGIISGDIKVNEGVIYDNNEKTFLVVHVEKGDKVVVNSKWKAWYTSHYSEELVVAARQAAHPTWHRQDSKLN